MSEVPKQAELDPLREEVPAESLETLVPKVMALATSHKRYNFTAVAMQAGLTRAELRYVMNSEAYQVLMAEQQFMLTLHTVLSGIRRMEEILNNPCATHSNQIEAQRLLVRSLDAMQKKQAAPAPKAASRSDNELENEPDDAEAPAPLVSFEAMLAKLKQERKDAGAR